MPIILVTLGGKDQEDCSLKPAQANSPRDSILKKPITHTKRSGRVAQGVGQVVGPEFKPQYCKKEKKKSCIYLKERNKMSFTHL
jgi:hypothetical protein